MNCLVTAGPTYEPLDDVRRLTNFSTGRLGCELAAFLAAAGHAVTLLVGQQATWRGERRANRLIEFTTTENLRDHFKALSATSVDAIFHAAAVSDFRFGKVWQGPPGAALTEVNAGKISSRYDRLFAELVPAPKIIARLREWYPSTRIVGWKYEVDGGRTEAIAKAEQQLRDCRTDACVTNGRAYGLGFGLVTGPGRCEHFGDVAALYAALERFTRS